MLRQRAAQRTAPRSSRRTRRPTDACATSTSPSTHLPHLATGSRAVSSMLSTRNMDIPCAPSRSSSSSGTRRRRPSGRTSPRSATSAATGATASPTASCMRSAVCCATSLRYGRCSPVGSSAASPTRSCTRPSSRGSSRRLRRAGCQWRCSRAYSPSPPSPTL